jgi:hypothetical protein
MNDFIGKTESITETINTMCFMHADDIALTIKTHVGLKCALKHAELHSKENEYKINVKKCATIRRKNAEFKIDKEGIVMTQNLEYIGASMNLHGIQIKEQISKNINKTSKNVIKRKGAECWIWI